MTETSDCVTTTPVRVPEMVNQHNDCDFYRGGPLFSGFHKDENRFSGPDYGDLSELENRR